MSFYLGKKEMFRTQENYSASKSQYLLATEDVDLNNTLPDTFFALPTHKLFMSVDDSGSGAVINLDFPVKDAQFVVTGVYCIKSGNGTTNGEQVVLFHVDETGAANTLCQLNPLGPYGAFDALADGTACWFDEWPSGQQVFKSGDTLRVQKQEQAGSDLSCQLLVEVAFI